MSQRRARVPAPPPRRRSPGNPSSEALGPPSEGFPGLGPGPESETILSETNPDPQSARPLTHHSPHPCIPPSHSASRSPDPNAPEPKSVAAGPAAAILASDRSCR